MSPSVIARTAKERGLQMAALCDHNTALNTPAFAAACAAEGLTGIYGMEATTREEAHILCLFETPEAALSLGEFIYELLPEIPNDPEKMGDQVYVDAEENILGEVEKVLMSGADISLEALLEEVHRRGGLFIPAHIDRPVFSIPSQLGFLPPLITTPWNRSASPAPSPSGERRPGSSKTPTPTTPTTWAAVVPSTRWRNRDLRG